MVSHLVPIYSRVELAFERGEGCWLYTVDGEPYLDFTSGIAVNALGHAHPALVDALTVQARKLWHVSNLFFIPGQERLAERLCDLTFADRVIFTNSGAEAIECALKMIRKHFVDRAMPERHRVIAFDGAFHGRTLAALAATGRAALMDGFAPHMPGFDHVAYGDVDALVEAITPETAALLIEPIQGEGGIRVAPSGFLRQLRTIADERGLLLVLDEIQCGMGRSGRLFVHEWDDVRPDIMVIAKAIGGGVPLGACLATIDAARGMTAGTHGSTYGGNPLVMAVGRALLDIVCNPDFLERIIVLGTYFKEKLIELSHEMPNLIKDVRGMGLMLGIQCGVPVADMLQALREEKLLAAGAGDNVVRLLPPLVVVKDEIDEALDRIERAGRRLTQK